jgi:N-acetylglucosaminyldiphosphoundecaprenol N-acetyl-beta-D-mannosaminyltransferase
MKAVTILDIPIDNLSKTELLEKLNDKGGLVVTPNVHHLVMLRDDPELREAYRKADYRICDSKIVQYASIFLGHPIKEKISGSDLFPAFYDYNKDNQKTKVFLLGAQPGIARQAQEKINQKVGREMIIDNYSPPLGFEKDERECQKILQLIHASEATVLVLGLGTPKQEKWIIKYRDRLKKILIIFAIGATIDFEAGNKSRSPKWMSDVGLEWFYRLICEPKRLWRRYLIECLPFVGLVIKQKLTQKRFRKNLSTNLSKNIKKVFNFPS